LNVYLAWHSIAELFEHDARAGVLPALVARAALGAGLVIDKSVVVGIAELVDPGERETKVVVELVKEVESTAVGRTQPHRADSSGS
jgi:hypothetical protein